MNRDYYNNFGGEKFTSRGYIDPRLENNYSRPNEWSGRWNVEVSPNSHKVLECLKRYAGEDVSLAQIAEQTGLTRAQIYSALDSLTHYDPRIAIDPDAEVETLHYLSDDEYGGRFTGI